MRWCSSPAARSPARCGPTPSPAPSCPLRSRSPRRPAPNRRDLRAHSPRTRRSRGGWPFCKSASIAGRPRRSAGGTAGPPAGRRSPASRPAPRWARRIAGCASTPRWARPSRRCVIPFGLFPFTPRDAAAKLRALPESSPEARRRKLARGEHLLEQSARVEAQGRSLVPHALGGRAFIAAGLTQGAVNKRPLFSGLVKLVGGMVLCSRRRSSPSPPRPSTTGKPTRRAAQTGLCPHRMLAATDLPARAEPRWNRRRRDLLSRLRISGDDASRGAARRAT